MLQSGYDVVTHGTTTGQKAFAALVLLVIFSGITYILHRSRYSGIEFEDRVRDKATVLRERFYASPVSVTIPYDAGWQDIHDRVIQGHENAIDGNGDPEHISFRDIGGDARRVISQAWSPVFQKIPLWSRRVAEFGIVLGISGAIAVDGERIAEGLEGGVGKISLQDVATKLLEATTTLADFATDIAFSFPFIDILWSLTFTTVILLGEWAYSRWYVTAPLIIAGAAAVAAVEWRLSDDVDELYGNELFGDHWIVASRVAIGAAAVWVVGVFPTALGTAAGAEHAGAVVGLIAASLQFFGGVYLGGRWTINRGKRIASIPREDDDVTYAAAAWLSVRYVWTVLSLACAPLLAAYLAVMVVEGRLVLVIEAFLNSGPEIHSTALLVVLSIGATVAWQIRETWGDIRSATRTLLSKQAYRAKLAKQGMPILVWILGYAGAYGFVRSIPVSLLAATVLALGSRTVYTVLVRVRHRASIFGDGGGRTNMKCDVYPPIEDYNGTEYAIARIDGKEWVMGDDIHDVATDVATAVNEYDEGLVTVFGMSRAEAAFGSGIVNNENARQKAEEKARKAILNELRPVGSYVSVEDYENAVEGIPSGVVETVRDRHADAIREDGDYLQLVYDPYAKAKRAEWQSMTVA